MAGNARFPDFFVIGVEKSGTTSLYEILKQHPHVHMPFAKEVSFFTNDSIYAQGVDWYTRTYFSDVAPEILCGENTPRYLYWGKRVALRIHSASPGRTPRFVAIFRDPVARAYSAYWQDVQHGYETLSFEEAIEKEDERLKNYPEDFTHRGAMTWAYQSGGRYAEQLPAYFDLFPRESFLFLLMDDLRADFAGTARRLFHFLGVDPAHPVQPEASNQAAMPRSRSLHNWLRGPNVVKRILKNILPLPMRNRLLRAATNANLKSFEYPPMKPETARMLRERFAPSVRELEVIIKRDLSKWRT